MDFVLFSLQSIEDFSQSYCRKVYIREQAIQFFGYVSYHVKTDTSLTKSPELYTSIGTSIDELKYFYQRQVNFLLTLQTELFIEHGLGLETHYSPGSSREKEKACMALEKFCSSVEKLQSFYQVNTLAVDRIFGKLEKCDGSPGELNREYKSKWMELKIHFQGELLKLNGSSKEFVTCGMCVLCHEPSSSQPVHIDAEISDAIQNDEPLTLRKLLEVSPTKDPSRSEVETLFYHLVEISVMYHSKQSIRYLLSKAFSASMVSPDHNLLNLIITRWGNENLRVKSQPMQRKQALCETCGDGSVECLLVIVVDEVYHDQKNLLAIDCLGRLSLHYGALYGFGKVCQTIIHHTHTWGQGQVSRLIFTLDSQGYTPFHYAVVENHVAVARVFINILLEEIQSSGKPDKNIRSNMQNLLNIAIRYQFGDMVELLGESQLSFGGVSAHEESPLYVAAQIGRDDYLDILLHNGQMEVIDGSEALNGWTPLFIACINGHRKAAELLIKAGANQEVCDFRGWYPKEHAALRGHVSLAELLKSWDRTRMTGGPASIPLRPSRTVGFHLPININHAIVNIRSLQNGRHLKGIDLKMPSSKDTIFTEMLPPMNMSVSVGGSSSHLVHLPVLGDMSNEPFIFPLHDSNDVHLVFKLFSADSSRELIGSASILLQEELDCLGPNRESLFRARTIPILVKETSDLLGTVTFTFLIAQKSMNSRNCHLSSATSQSKEYRLLVIEVLKIGK
jgi:glycerophosphodiester phosphodiesterase